MELLPGKTLEQLLKDFNRSSSRVEALSHNKFLNDRVFDGRSIMDALYSLQKFFKYHPYQEIKKGMTIETNINLVLEFYDTLGLRDRVEPIILGKHPMFDTVIDDKSPSRVSIRAYDRKLKFSAGQAKRASGVFNLTHESAHAINGYYNQMQNIVREQNTILDIYGEDSKEFDEFASKTNDFIKVQEGFMHDSITEIGSRIMELLLLDFLLEKNTISPEDKDLYIQQRNLFFRNYVRLMVQDDIIYSNIIQIKKKHGNHNPALTEDEYYELMQKLEKHSHHKQLVERFHTIADRKKQVGDKWYSKKILRYVIAEVVSRVWYDNYCSAGKQQKQNMIKDLKKFIANNHNINLIQAFELLLHGQSYTDIFNNFVALSKNQHEAKEQ